MILKLIHTFPFLKRLYVNRFGPKWVEAKIGTFINHLNKGDTVLDIGSGGGLISKTLRGKGFQTTPLDVADLSYTEDTKPIVYDGVTMPFENKQFDVALLLTILHHTTDPVRILQETRRVANRIIIIEDIYESVMQRNLTFAADRIVNWGFSSCPHTNKDDGGWKALFKELDLELYAVSYHNVFGFFKQAVYYLKD